MGINYAAGWLSKCKYIIQRRNLLEACFFAAVNLYALNIHSVEREKFTHQVSLYVKSCPII